MNRILEAAFYCFCRTGYDKTRMDDVANKARVSKGALYLYFKSKEDLFTTIGQVQVERLRLELTRIFSHEGDLAEKVSTLYGNLRQSDAGSEAVNLEVIAESTRNPRLRKILQSQRTAAHDAVSDSLRHLAEEGVISTEIDFDALATGYVALYEGLTIDIVLGTQDALIKRAWNQTTKVMIEGTVRRG